MSRALTLPAELTIYTVAECLPVWLSWVAEPAADGAEAGLEVDGAGLEEVDAAGVQLLVALSNSLARDQRSLRVTGPSAPLRLALEQLGLTSLLQPAGMEA